MQIEAPMRTYFSLRRVARRDSASASARSLFFLSVRAPLSSFLLQTILSLLSLSPSVALLASATFSAPVSHPAGAQPFCRVELCGGGGGGGGPFPANFWALGLLEESGWKGRERKRRDRRLGLAFRPIVQVQKYVEIAELKEPN